MEGDFNSSNSTSYLQKQLKLLEETAARTAGTNSNSNTNSNDNDTANTVNGNPSSTSTSSGLLNNNFSPAALANTAALFNYANVVAAGIPIPKHMATLSSFYNRLQPCATTAATGTTNGTYSITAGGPIRPTAALHAARLVQRPLGRTQSAPLPLGHPALLPNCGSPTSTGKTQPTTSSLVKQHIRNAVLTRASSKGQMVENVEEETEAAVAAEAMMQDGTVRKKTKENPEDMSDQVIDLTKKRSTSEEESTSTATNATNAVDIFSNLSPFRLTSTASVSNLQQAIQQQQLHQQQLSLLEANAAVAGLPTTSLVTYPFIDPTFAAFYQRTAAAATANAAATSASAAGAYIPGSAFRSPLIPGQLSMNYPNTHHPHSALNHYQFHHGSTHPGRPLSRTLSSPQVMLSHNSHNESPGSPGGTTSPDLIHYQQQQLVQQPPPNGNYRYTTALVYDSFMQKHQCNCNDTFQHPEHGGRLQSIWARITETGLAARCEVKFIYFLKKID